MIIIIRLKKPDIDIAELLEQCTENIRCSCKSEKNSNNVKRCKENNCRSKIFNDRDNNKEIKELYKEYDRKMENNLLSDISELQNAISINYIDESHKKCIFDWLYNNRLVKGNGRKYYDRLMNATKLCPICGKTKVRQLDHFLPRESFPFHSINPYNLIPLCSDCNKDKGVKISNINPYYKWFKEFSWLKCIVIIKDNQPIFTFDIEKDDSINDKEFEDLKINFEIFKLGEKYSVLASSEYYEDECRLKKALSDSEKNLIADINEIIESAEKSNRFSLKPSMYKGLLSCEEYILYLSKL